MSAPTPPPPPVSVVIPAYNRAATHRRGDRERAAPDLGRLRARRRRRRLDRRHPRGRAAAIADPRLRVIAAPRNIGAAGARNLGVAEARGTWIAFQDSDDEWLPEKLAKQMARLATAPGDGDCGGATAAC